MAKDGEHFFKYLLAICSASFQNFLFSSFAHFIHWVVDSLWGEFFELPINSAY
jgi:hypothetical protein